MAAGYQNDVIEAGETLVDEPLEFADGTTKSSFFNRDGKVAIDDQEALMVSSNVYMQYDTYSALQLSHESGGSIIGYSRIG